MITVMRERAQRWWIALAALGGCLLIAVVQSSHGGGFSPRLGVQGPDAYYGPDPYTPLIPTAATVLALCLVRWWPWLVAAGGLLCLPVAWPQLNPDPRGLSFYYAFGAALPLLVIGVLGAAQRLLGTVADRRATGEVPVYGALVLAQLPLYAQQALGGSEQVVTVMLVVFSAGIGIGSLLSERLSE